MAVGGVLGDTPLGLRPAEANLVLAEHVTEDVVAAVASLLNASLRVAASRVVRQVEPRTNDLRERADKGPRQDPKVIRDAVEAVPAAGLALAGGGDA